MPRAAAVVLVFVLGAWTALPSLAAARRLVIAITPVIVDSDVSLKSDWAKYLERHTKRPVQFVQRGSYREVLMMVQYGDVDFAWICGYPYVRNLDLLQLVAVPLYKGAPYYQSYTIVRRDSALRGLEDLRGRIHAFSDLDSNSGHLVPRFLLQQMGTTPERYFAHYIFTNSHENVVRSVAFGLTDSGSVDGYVWDVLNRTVPELQGRTEVIHRSERYGFPPIVANRSKPAEEVNAFRSQLLAMNTDPEGQQILKRLHLDGFTPGSQRLFDGIADIMSVVDRERSTLTSYAGQ